jgi:hypothetical protein
MIHLNDEAQMLTRGIFLDVAGAFDAVPHFLLMHKLKSYGIGANLLLLLDSYLQGRNIKVGVNNYSYSGTSKPDYINRGVPQGSILGPLLFLIGRGYIHGFHGPKARTLVASTDSVDRRSELSLRSRIFWTEGQNSRCVHGFRGPKARALVAFTDSVDRKPELSLRSRIPWTERQNSRCVHGFRGPNARSIVAFTDSVNRMPGVVIASTDLYSTRIMRIVRVMDSDAMKSRGTYM